jgi:cysteine desulfurase/selenocysteine lyase
VLRPINALVDDGATRTFVPVDPETGRVDPDDIRKTITPHTRLIATLHGSNVSGTLQPIEAIGRIAREHGVPFLVDAAQTLGHLPLDVQSMPIDMLAFPGHKGLLGPLGTGGLYIRPELVEQVTPLREGGTGSVSEQDTQPTFMPDRYETGSHNAIGLVGLGASLQWILDRGVASLWQHELALTADLLEGVRTLPGLRVLGPQITEHRCGVFSLTQEALSPAEFAAIMEDQFGILGRPGIHCAPRAHRTFGTEAGGGALRLSLGPFLTSEDVQHVVQSLHAVCSSGIST